MLRTLMALSLALTPAMALAATTPQINQPVRATDMGQPTLLVPPSSIGIDLCLGEASGAYGSPMLAITLSTPHRDQDCTDLRLSKWAADLGAGHPRAGLPNRLRQQAVARGGRGDGTSVHRAQSALVEALVMDHALSGPVLVLTRLHSKLHLRAAEWLTALMLLTWGGELLLYPQLFQRPLFRWLSPS